MIGWLDLFVLGEGYRDVAVGREIDGVKSCAAEIGILDDLQEALQLLVDVIEAEGDGHVLPWSPW